MALPTTSQGYSNRGAQEASVRTMTRNKGPQSTACEKHQIRWALSRVPLPIGQPECNEGAQMNPEVLGLQDPHLGLSVANFPRVILSTHIRRSVCFYSGVGRGNINWLPPARTPTGFQICNLGMYPDRESNLWPFGSWDCAATNRAVPVGAPSQF